MGFAIEKMSITLKMRWLRFALYIQCVFSIHCTSHPKSNFDFYSVAKSQQNDKYGSLIEDQIYFYRFQTYFKSAASDSNSLSSNHFNFTGNEVIGFLKNQYLKKNETSKIELLSKIEAINSENLNNEGIIVIDLNDTISLINLSPEFALYPIGSCCSPYQNIIIRKRNNAIYHSDINDELISGKFLGVYANNRGEVNGLLIEGYSNSNGDFKGLNANYTLKYDVIKTGIIASEVINVRGGEPFDKNDQPKDIYKKNVVF